MPKIIRVMYTVPVACNVDTESGRIVDVVVDDENVERQPGAFLDERGEVLAECEATARAEAVAEADDVAWPPWRFGY